MRRVIALSGPVSSGKSTLAKSLASWDPEISVFKTRQMIQDLRESQPERQALQAAGESLDRNTGGKWVAQDLAKKSIALPHDASVVLDSVRISGQVAELRRVFGSRVIHVHLTAPYEELKRRYSKRKSKIGELETYDDVRADATEQQVESLEKIADIVIDTRRCTESDVVVRAASHLGLHGRGYAPLVDILVGGQWGSEGKGHVASYLAPEYDVLVRVGGPNAGHQVYRKNGPTTYYQLPSGTQECEALIVIGPGAVISVDTLQKELASSPSAATRLRIDPQAMVIEITDVKRENSALRDIGSTKQGVGYATSRKILRTAANPPVRLARDVPELEPYLTKASEVLKQAFRKGHRIFLEGTQGTGLSLHHGAYPYVTSRDTTASGCLAEAGIAPSRVRRTIMVVRSYPIRVGGAENSGPMGLKLSYEELARRSGHSARVLRATERTSTTNRPRRIAEFNWTLLRESAAINGPTDIALSFTDYICKGNENARRFEQLTSETIRFVEEVERVACAPVSMIVTRFRHSARSIIDRRDWGER